MLVSFLDSDLEVMSKMKIEKSFRSGWHNVHSPLHSRSEWISSLRSSFTRSTGCCCRSGQSTIHYNNSLIVANHYSNHYSDYESTVQTTISCNSTIPKTSASDPYTDTDLLFNNPVSHHHIHTVDPESNNNRNNIGFNHSRHTIFDNTITYPESKHFLTNRSRISIQHTKSNNIIRYIVDNTTTIHCRPTTVRKR